jgi:hypothetical protein
MSFVVPIPRWLAALGVTIDDLAAFGPDLRPDGRALLARHCDAEGRALGTERVSAGPDGRLRYGYHPAGLPKGCMRSARASAAAPAAPPLARVVLACGPLPALCAAALDGHRPGTVYLGAGGCWTAAVAETVGVVIEAGAGEVVLAFADTPTGERSAEAAIMHLRRAHLPLRRLVRRRPAAGTWPETLRWIRSGEGQPGVAA